MDEMGPVAAKSYPGTRLVLAQPQIEPRRDAQRAKQEIDYGRRDKGYVFGAFRHATGEVLTRTYKGRTTANWVDFLQQVEQWVPESITRIYAIIDNLSAHRANDVLLFNLQHSRWEFVFQPTYAAYLNLIEPWWKVLRSLALKGRRYETWPEIESAVEAATSYWNKHRHPFIWGQRRRHQPRRRSGIAEVPKAA
jgi:transposase